MTTSVSALLPSIKTGQIRALALSGDRASSRFSNVEKQALGPADFARRLED